MKSGVAAVMFGAGGDGAHAAEEWADEASVEALADVLLAAAAAFCGPARGTEPATPVGPRAA